MSFSRTDVDDRTIAHAHALADSLVHLATTPYETELEKQTP